MKLSIWQLIFLDQLRIKVGFVCWSLVFLFVQISWIHVDSDLLRLDQTHCSYQIEDCFYVSLFLLVLSSVEAVEPSIHLSWSTTDKSWFCMLIFYFQLVQVSSIHVDWTHCSYQIAIKLETALDSCGIIFSGASESQLLWCMSMLLHWETCWWVSWQHRCFICATQQLIVSTSVPTFN